MTQAHPDKKPSSPPLGVAAAAAATSAGGSAKPTDKPEDKPAAGNGAAAAAAEKKQRGARKVYVVVGQVHEFETVAKAEKFLNAEGAPADYTVLRGNRIARSTKVSLR